MLPRPIILLFILLFFLQVIVAIITFALAHMGTLIIMTKSQNFSRVDLAWRSLWANFAIGYRKSMKDFRSDIWISPSFAVLSGLILFALKKLVCLCLKYS